MAHPLQEQFNQERRNFLATSASGIGTLALASLMQQDRVLAAEDSLVNPLAPKPPHFAPKAKNCIYIYMAGAPSQIDLFDPKPKLNELDGDRLPDEMTEKVRFAFIQKETARLMGTPRTFQKYGQCGMDFCDLLPNIAACADDIAMIRSMHSDAFNHHPGQLLMNTGYDKFGYPSIGSWINYGLGSESQNLPGYVVLTAGRGTSGGASNWQSGFLPSTYQGVLFRNKGEAVLNLNNPPGVTHEMQRTTLDAVSQLNQARFETINDPEINSRIASYELAFRMQSSAPELIDFSDEPDSILEEYGVNRTEHIKNYQDQGAGEFGAFASNCLLARRLVERGVRFVNLFHATWDHHENIDKGLKFNCFMADQPIAALIKDLKRRGLLDETLVIWGTEFGRTPLGENRVGRSANTGRDHHPFAFTMWMAGGGIKGGTIYGETDDIGWNITKDPVHVNDFHATVLHLFGIDHLKLTYRFQGRDFRLTDVGGKIITPLLV